MMHHELQEILNKYRNKRNFKANKWVESKIEKFNAYINKHKLTGAVVSISGGIDSAVTLKLLALSNLKKIIPVNQPVHSSDWGSGKS